MEQKPEEKKTKSVSKPSTFAALRVKKDTRRRATQELAKINKKDEFKVRMNDYVSFALSLVTAEHYIALQEASLSHKDRFERDYKAYVVQNGMISKDEYLGKRLAGELDSVPMGGSPSEQQ